MIFHIYRCGSCNYIGYAKVESKASEHTCAICGGLIQSTETDTFSDNIKYARKLATQLAIRHSRPNRAVAKRGLGVRKRVLNIVSALISLNHNRPVKRAEILVECDKANISRDRADYFLSQLEQEEILEIVAGECVMINGGIL